MSPERLIMLALIDGPLSVEDLRAVLMQECSGLYTEMHNLLYDLEGLRTSGYLGVDASRPILTPVGRASLEHSPTLRFIARQIPKLYRKQA